MIFGKKWSKNYMLMCKCSSIANLNTNSTIYTFPVFDNFLKSYPQNSVPLIVQNNTIQIFIAY